MPAQVPPRARPYRRASSPDRRPPASTRTGQRDVGRVRTDVVVPGARAVPVRSQGQVHLDPRDRVWRQRRPRVERHADAQELGEGSPRSGRRSSVPPTSPASGPPSRSKIRDRRGCGRSGRRRSPGRAARRDPAGARRTGARSRRRSAVRAAPAAPARARRRTRGRPRPRSPASSAPASPSRSGRSRACRDRPPAPRRQRRAERPLVEGVVDPGRGRQEDDGRALAHPRARGRQLRAVDVEEELDAVDGDLHESLSSGLTSSRKRRSSS